MFVDVEAFLFNALIDAQTVQLLDAIEQNESAGSSPKVDNQNTETFSTEEAPAVAVERTVRSREQTSHQSTENTADTVYRAGTHRIVDMQHMVDKLNGKDQHETTDKTNDNSTYGRNEVTT